MSWNIKYSSLNEFISNFESEDRIWTKFGEISSVEVFHSWGETYVNLFTIQNGSRIRNVSKYQYTVHGFLSLDFSKVLPGLTIFLKESDERSADDWDLLTSQEKEKYIETGNTLLNESRLIPEWPLAETTYSPNIDVYEGLNEIISGSTLQCPGFATVNLTKTLIIKNTGTAPLRLKNSIVATQMQNASFSISQPSSTVIQAGSQTTFSFTISALNPGTYTCQIIISSNDENEGAYVININSVIAAAPAPILRGYSALKSIDTDITFPVSFSSGDEVTGILQIANEGNSTLQISGVSLQSDAPFLMLNGDPVSISSGASYNYNILFAPMIDPGIASGTLTLSFNDPSSPKAYNLYAYII